MLTTTHIRYIPLATIADLESYIDATITKAKTLKDRIQIAAVGTLIHIGKHGDTDTGLRLANKMVNELGQGIQTKALADYFIAFGAGLSDDQKSLGTWDIDMLKARFNKSSSNPKAIREGAQGTHWATFAPVTPWGGFKLDDKLESLIAQAGAAVDRAEKNPEESDVVDINPKKLDLLGVIAQLSEEQCDSMLTSLQGTQETEASEENHSYVDFDAPEAVVA